jgi:hypothetical protein
MILRMPVGRSEEIAHLGERETCGTAGNASDRSIIGGPLKIRRVNGISPCRRAILALCDGDSTRDQKKRKQQTCSEEFQGVRSSEFGRDQSAESACRLMVSSNGGLRAYHTSNERLCITANPAADVRGRSNCDYSRSEP